MSRKCFIPAATLFLLLFALAFAAPARAEMCSAVCSTSVLCSTDCEVCARGADNQDGSCTNGTRWTTCSGAGFPCTTCFPNWQDTHRTLQGVFEKNWFFYCEQFGVYDVFQTDLNHCQSDRVVCDEVLVGRGYGVGVSCCAGGMCFGKQSC